MNSVKVEAFAIQNGHWDSNTSSNLICILIKKWIKRGNIIFVLFFFIYAIIIIIIAHLDKVHYAHEIRYGWTLHIKKLGGNEFQRTLSI